MMYRILNKVFPASCLVKSLLAGLFLSVTGSVSAQLRPVIPPGDTLDLEVPHAVEHRKVETFTVEGVTFNMVKVTGGTFSMGATEEQGEEAYDTEFPVHTVTLPDYYIGETEVTQELWEAMIGHNPSHFKGKNLPVECVRYIDIDLFLMKLEYYTGVRFRLPTEQEWEFAARGGNLSQRTKYAGSEDFDTVAWYCNNSGNRTHEVKGKAPNELGIYDMSGNVEEWCEDIWHPYTEDADEENDKNAKVSRGGGYLDFARHLRVSDRRRVPITIYNSDIGLRLAR